MAVVAILLLYFGLNFLKGVDIFSPINYYYATYEKYGRPYAFVACVYQRF